MPCAPVNSNVGEERRTSKGSMTGHIPSELLGGWVGGLVGICDLLGCPWKLVTR